MPTVNPQDQYRCPKCGLADRVVKASVSEKVSAPQRNDFGFPKTYESPWGCVSVGFIIFAVVAFLYVTIVNIALHAPNAGASSLVVIVLIVIAALIAIYNVREAKTRQTEVTRYNAELQARNEADQERYDRAEKRYQQLYYCERNDVVFIPGEPETCMPAPHRKGSLEYS